MNSEKYWGFGRVTDVPEYKIVATSPAKSFSDVYKRYAVDGWEFFAMSYSYDAVERIMTDWVSEWQNGGVSDGTRNIHQDA